MSKNRLISHIFRLISDFCALPYLLHAFDNLWEILECVSRIVIYAQINTLTFSLVLTLRTGCMTGIHMDLGDVIDYSVNEEFRKIWHRALDRETLSASTSTLIRNTNDYQQSTSPC